ncbi:MAG: GTPase [Phycisphaerae bacterium]
MPELPRVVFQRAEEWSRRAACAGWLGQSQLDRLRQVERAAPADLFEPLARRPLVVALFGGTGVGKSSLLNRLAGEAVARVGVERPTSREVTLYLHESTRLAALPPELPVDRTRIAQHRDATRADVLWIDMPDIDSTQEQNRHAALQWLPHIDLVVYVVSPERYRDDRGWRVLQQRAARHGWAFVMNRGDEGHASQRDDFAALLRSAGFEKPLLIRTCCAAKSNAPRPDDEFQELERAIRAALDAHGIEELERLGQRARFAGLREALLSLREKLGDDAKWNIVREQWRRIWAQAGVALAEGAEWPLRVASAEQAVRPGGTLARLAQRFAKLDVTGAARAIEHAQHGDGERLSERGDQRAGAATTASGDAPDSREARLALDGAWDDWSDARCATSLDSLELFIDRQALPAQPVRAAMDGVARDARARVAMHVNEHVRAALVKPGAAWQRALRRVTGFLTVLMPLLAMLWVAWQVVAGYRRASLGTADFLGGAFAIHSALLVLIAWAIPFSLDYLLRPSFERLILESGRRGVSAGLRELQDEFAAALDRQIESAAMFRAELDGIVDSIPNLQPSADKPAAGVERLIARTPSV